MYHHCRGTEASDNARKRQHDDVLIAAFDIASTDSIERLKRLETDGQSTFRRNCRIFNAKVLELRTNDGRAIVDKLQKEYKLERARIQSRRQRHWRVCVERPRAFDGGLSDDPGTDDSHDEGRGSKRSKPS